MLGGVQNITSTTSSVKLIGNFGNKNIPQINSLVNVSVLDKLGSSFKILVDGSVFQSALPFNAEIGEQLVAKVIGHKPFTLGINKLTSAGGNNSAIISAILGKLELAESPISKSALKIALSNDKPLSKSKLKSLIAYLEEHGLLFDELQLAMLVNLIWLRDDESNDNTLSSYNSLFDISFEQLAKEIFNTITTIYKKSPNETISQKINDLLVLKIDESNSKMQVSAVKDKSADFVQLAKIITELEKLNKIPLFISMELSSLKKLGIKYILQKALFNRFDIHPEFVIVNITNQFKLIMIKYDRIYSDSSGISYNLASIFETDQYGKLVFNAYFGGEKLSGDIAVSSLKYNKLKPKEAEINHNISQKFKIYSGIKIVLSSTSNSINNNKYVNIKSINRIA